MSMIKGNKAKQVKLLVLDVDGVMTDGVMVYGAGGEEFKSFYVRDGKGVNLAQVAGIRVAIITSENIPIVSNRAKKLKIKDVYLGIKNKAKVLDKLAEKYGLEYDQIAFIGDDINDIPVLEKVGFPVAVNNAVEEVKEVVKSRDGYITQKNGGKGAIRETVEFILKSKGMWKEIVERDLKRQRKERE